MSGGRRTTVVLLPPDIFNDLDGSRTLQLVLEALDRTDATPTA